MSLINVTNVEILDNPTKFTNPFQFEITFECLPPGIREELEWKLVYVGSAEDESKDQELDCVDVGPVVIGKNKFVFQTDAPNADLIPPKDLMEVTVLLLTCSYRGREFIRIGYYVNNEYPESEVELHTARQAYLQQQQQLQLQYQQQCAELQAQNAVRKEQGEEELPLPPPPSFPPPPPVHVDRLWRNVLANKPRVTRFQIPWDEQIAEFRMDAADEAKAMEEENAAAAAAANAGVSSDSAAAVGEGEGEEEEEEEEVESSENEEMMDEGEEGEEEEDDGEEAEEEEHSSPMHQHHGPQGMQVE